MKRPEAEYWALQVIERVVRHEPVEDDLVELKADWPSDYAGAARRIAAHANGARMQPILWLIGVDEKAGLVKGATAVDPATWFGRIVAEFVEGWAPDISIYSFPHTGRTVVALIFRTEGAPYVVRAPNERFEVPWRGSTQTRSARRSELISILYPASRTPSVDVLDARVMYRVTVSTKVRASHPFIYSWQAQLELYVTPRDSERLVFPFHRMQAYATTTDRRVAAEFTNFAAGADDSKGSPMTYATKHEVIVGGPGRISMHMENTVEEALDFTAAAMPMTFHLIARAASSDTSINLAIPCEAPKIVPNTSATWYRAAG